ncbi:MAG: 3-isopropylmalate dehydratase [Candidatus Omnitrophota bacterium]|jgi:3-isopropylmalate/(R)-2-methylmalate dehydratase small subunit|nr:MAG: 3-isopropylmalate dehydratase [Candidatus Omnitrophota bacterium]
MENIIKGKAFVLGDDIDTDQIIPAQYLVYKLDDEEERKKYGELAMSGVPDAQSGLPDGHIPFVQKGKWTTDYAIIIGGKNFGCGSSREHAPFALNIAGVKAVVAESYARIFFRNSVNGGYLVPFETPSRLIEKIATGDEIEIDVQSSTLKNLTRDESFELCSLGDVEKILRAGDVFAYAKEAGMIEMR